MNTKERHEKKGADTWVPFASYLTTGQFEKLGGGFVQHCGPTAAANIILTLQRGLRAMEEHGNPAFSENAAFSPKTCDPATSGDDGEAVFLMCAEVGRKMGIYWNRTILGYFGGTSNYLAGIFLRRCLNRAGLHGRTKIRFHPWLTPDLAEKALEEGSILYLEVMFHKKYKNHHMVCYACRRDSEGGRSFLLADGWKAGPVWITENDLGHGHFLTVQQRL